MTHYTAREQKQLAYITQRIHHIAHEWEGYCVQQNAILTAFEEEIALKDVLLERIITQMKGGFNPNQPRVPSGTPNGG